MLFDRLPIAKLGQDLQRSGLIALRVALVLVFLGFGYIKFFPFEAEALAPLFATSPILGWLPQVFGGQGASIALGIVELTTAALLASRLVSPTASVLGGLMSCATFLVTLTLLVSVPAAGVWEASAGGFPALGALGTFLIKDAVLLTASIVLLGESLQATALRPVLLKG